MSTTTTTTEDRLERGADATAAGAAALLVAAVLVLSPGPAAGQDARAPETASAPDPFRLGPTVSRVTWEEAEGPDLGDVTLWGPAIERLVTSFLAVRLEGGYGTGTVSGPDRTVDVNTYLIELDLTLRAPVIPVSGTSVVPYAAGGLGTVVHDPSPDDLSTASQNAFSYGLGLDVRPLRRLGARLEWRRYSVDLENLLDPVDRTGSSRRADRFAATVYWTF